MDAKITLILKNGNKITEEFEEDTVSDIFETARQLGIDWDTIHGVTDQECIAVELRWDFPANKLMRGV